MGGWAATEAAIDLQFQKAEQQGVCLVSSSRSLRRALAARASEDMLISPLPGMFARPAYWNALSRPEKLLLVVRTDALLHPTWVFSHATAAFVLGLDVSYNLIWPINFLTDNPGGGKHPPPPQAPSHGLQRLYRKRQYQDNRCPADRHRLRADISLWPCPCDSRLRAPPRAHRQRRS